MTVPSGRPADPFDATDQGVLPVGGRAEAGRVDPFEQTRESVAPAPPDAGVGDTNVGPGPPDEEDRGRTREDLRGDDVPTVTAAVEPTAQRGDVRAASPTAIACPSCRFIGEAGARFCVRCGADLRIGPAAPAARSRTPPMPTAEITVPMERDDLDAPGGARRPRPRSVGRCPGCEARVRDASSQCGQCGQVIGELLTLVTITPDGDEGEALTPIVGEAVLGRAEEADLAFPDDLYLSPRHAVLHVAREAVYVDDLGSLNGTFVRLHEATPIGPGDTLVIGRQLLRLEAVGGLGPKDAEGKDGTRLLGSPPPAGDFVLAQLAATGRVQDRYHLPAAGAVLGRDHGELRFPDDRCVSGRHAAITVERGRATLTDLDSSNGTWLRIRRRTPLQAGDEIYLGRQVFRVTFPLG